MEDGFINLRDRKRVVSEEDKRYFKNLSSTACA